MGVHWKMWFFWGGGGVAKKQYIGENCLRRGGLGQFADLRRAWQRRGVFFQGGWYPNAHYGSIKTSILGFLENTMYICIIPLIKL